MVFFQMPFLSFLRLSGAWFHPVKSPANSTVCAVGAVYEKVTFCFAILSVAMMVPCPVGLKFGPCLTLPFPNERVKGICLVYGVSTD